MKLTEEQIEIEKKIQDVVESFISKDISKEEGNEKIDQLLREGFKSGVFTKGDIRCYNQRRDRKSSEYGQRSHIDFAMAMRKSHVDEKKTFDHFMWYMKDVKKRDVTWRELGSDGKGYVMIANFEERDDTPLFPDYEVVWKGLCHNVEIKNFKDFIWLKIGNLKKYRKRNAYLVMGFNGAYYFCDNDISEYLLDNMPSCSKKIRGKDSIVITTDGADAHFSFKDLVKQKFIKQI